MPLWLELAATVVAAGLLLGALLDASFGPRQASAHRGSLTFWVLLTGGVLAAHALRVQVPGMPPLGYQGAVFLALTLGYRRALISLALVLAVFQPPLHWGFAVLTDALLPILLTLWLVQRVRRWLPPNPFVFLFACGFFAPFAIGAVQLGAGLGVDALRQALDGGAGAPLSGAFVWGLLLLGGEATLEGMLITLLVVYRPHEVALFDEPAYLSAGRWL